MRPVLARDVLGWDVTNWSRCLQVWEPAVSDGPLDCLEIGSWTGGLSLWLASRGHAVVCSDLVELPPAVRASHRSFDLPGTISYERIDATAIPYAGRFDRVLFKSVLGGVWAHCGQEGVRRAIEEMHKALKPGGKLLFAENLESTRIHMFFRERLLRRTRGVWVYPKVSEVCDLMKVFDDVRYDLSGFLGAFGPNETLRGLLGRVDRRLAPALPGGWRYIMTGVATKQEDSPSPQDEIVPGSAKSINRNKNENTNVT